jgi:hypothetical protein
MLLKMLSVSQGNGGILRGPLSAFVLEYRPKPRKSILLFMAIEAKRFADRCYSEITMLCFRMGKSLLPRKRRQARKSQYTAPMHPILKAPQTANIASAWIDTEKSDSIPRRYRGHPSFLQYPCGISPMLVSRAVVKVVDIVDRKGQNPRSWHGDHWSALSHVSPGMELIIGRNSMKETFPETQEH